MKMNATSLRSNPFIFLLLFISISLHAHDIDSFAINQKNAPPYVTQESISGIITDENGTPLEGANVVVKGTSRGTVTGADGQFILKLQPGDQVLIVSFSGYEPREIRIGNQSRITAALKKNDGQLQDVIIIGYGTQDKRALTSSVSVVSNKYLKDIKATSFEQLLAGQTPGVLVQQSTGHPGAGLNLKIRGTGSISALNDPLYVVDGMPIEAPGFNNRINVLSFLNPADIESITILKDAASTSIYGSRGANGVVLINTKTAKKGKTNIDANIYFGFQTIPKRGRLKMMNAEEFANFRIETLQDQAALNGTPFDPATIPAGYRNVKGPGTDWFDVVTRKRAPVQGYNITLRSGTDKTRSMISLDYFKQEGNVKQTTFDRISLRANVDVDVTGWLRYGARINPSYNMRNLGGDVEGFPTGSIMGFALGASPISPVYLPDGKLNPAIFAAPDNFVYPNPINRFNGVTDKRNDLRLLASNFLELDIIKGLTYKINIGVDMNNSSSRFFYPSYIGSPFGAFGASIALPPDYATGSAVRDEFITWLVENYVTFRRTFDGIHELEALVGHTAQKQEFDVISANGSRFPNDDIPYVLAAIPGDFRDGVAGSDAFRYALESVFGRIHYSYNRKYFLSGTLRRDGTSRFSPAARWGTFPSVSVGWMVSEESFMRGLETISELKLRGSYGVTGNNNIRESFAYVPGLNITAYVLGNQLVQGAVVGFADQGLKWESNRETDIGLDLSVLDNRISFTADWYKRITYDLLLGRPIPSITGIQSIQTNIGKIENKGFEFAVNARIMQQKALQWEAGANVSINRNKVLALNDNNNPIESGDQFGGSTTTAIGKPMGLFKGYVIDGVYRTEAEAKADAKHNPNAHAGTLKIRDVDNNGQITPNDRTVIGDPWAKFTFGLNSRLSYRNFDLSIQVTGSVGNKVILSVNEFAMNMDGPFNVVADIKNRWRSPDNPGNGIFPTTNYPDQRQYVRLANSTWVKDGSHARISNITAGYTFPADILERSRVLKACRLYLTVQNAFIFSKTPLNNPEASLQNGTLNMGWQRNTYPLARQINLGLNLSF